MVIRLVPPSSRLVESYTAVLADLKCGQWYAVASLRDISHPFIIPASPDSILCHAKVNLIQVLKPAASQMTSAGVLHKLFAVSSSTSGSEHG